MTGEEKRRETDALLFLSGGASEPPQRSGTRRNDDRSQS